MRLHRPDHRPAPEPIIALVDVVFFLLVFFLLVARLDASAPFEVLPPVAVSGRDMPGGGVTLSVARDGALAVNGNTAAAEDWLALVTAAAARNGARLIRINAHRDVALRHVLPLVSALEAAALGEVVIVVTPPES
ncbi:biopolymer transporter ExbD [Puniceibacterium sp. IMCC21224]|uniref:ExbD/TolR family protein n=1 Tax=Puniceibacterium sp. IMCC21224 TaxID=1618204 RepID=UPI00064DBCA8|nr:biopolymer transporter ExbD [Puniceibacterium sp. IMCC21224]KMK65240.1 biopolymer transport protein [Puniceibacterium sp. IMCC21224]